LKQVDVIVTGMAGTGKSTVARMIEVTLAEFGVNVKRVDNNGAKQPDEAIGVIEAGLEKRMESLLKGGLAVTVKTMMARRNPGRSVACR